MSANLPVVDPSRDPDAPEPDYRAAELAADRAECSPACVLLWLAEQGDFDERRWLDWPPLERRLQRGEALTTDQLVVLLFNAPAATALAARQQLLDRMRNDPEWALHVQAHLPGAQRDIEAADRSDGDECYAERAMWIIA